ncbi:TPA: hypothetical protein ACH3X3_002156 [Trebouxia sp. C0006]
MKSAFGLAPVAHGRAVVQHSRVLTEAHQLKPGQETNWLFRSHSSSCKHDSADEEMHIQENRLVWSCSGLVRKQFTTPQKIIQVSTNSSTSASCSCRTCSLPDFSIKLTTNPLHSQLLVQPYVCMLV